MAQYEHLPIYKTTYDLLIELMHVTKDFPREFKYSIGEKIQINIVELLVEIYKANSARDKKIFIEALLEKVQFLNLFLRIAFDLKLIPINRYSSLSKKLLPLQSRLTAGCNQFRQNSLMAVSFL